MKKYNLLLIAMIFLFACNNSSLTAIEYRNEITKIKEVEQKKINELSKKDGQPIPKDNVDEYSKMLKEQYAVHAKAKSDIIKLKGPSSLKDIEKEYDKNLQIFVDLYKKYPDELVKLQINSKEPLKDEFKTFLKKIEEANKVVVESDKKIKAESEKEKTGEKK